MNERIFGNLYKDDIVREYPESITGKIKHYRVYSVNEETNTIILQDIELGGILGSLGGKNKIVTPTKEYKTVEFLT